MATKTNTYNEDSIQHHKGLAAVRVRPGMYLGERGPSMVYRALKEIVDNAYDEYAAGRNLSIEVYVDTKTDTYIVADGAQGIPVGLHKTEKISTLTLILTELHAGGKFDDKAYKTAAGTHGVGAAATNAVSSSFECWTHRDKSWHYQAFREGKPVAALKRVTCVDKSVSRLLQSVPKSGTVIRFTPDQTIVSVDKGKTPAKLNVPSTAGWLRNLAMMNKNLSITFTSGGKTRTFLNKIGIVKMLKDRLAVGELEPMGKPIILEDDVLSFAVQWTSYPEEDGVASYVSSSTTRDGGTHLDEFYAAMTKVIGEFKLPRDKYAPRDLRNGLVGVLNFKMSQPEFSSQVKDRLTSNLEKSVYDRTYKFCKAFFTANKSLVRRIIKRASEVKKTKEQFKKLMDGVAKINSSKRGIMLPNILASARKCTSATREIFLVEGDSAAGCHFADVEVLLTDGSKKSFEQLVADHSAGLVNNGFAFDLDAGVSVPFEFVEPRIVKYVNEYVEMTLEDGSVWRGTTGHPWLLSSGGYVAASDLQVGDDVQEAHLPQDRKPTSD